MHAFNSLGPRILAATKTTDDVRFAVTTSGPEEADPQSLLDLARDHWSIENGPHYRRDRTQDEDRCPVRDTTAARHLSLFRSLAIFLFKEQAGAKGVKKSLADLKRNFHEFLSRESRFRPYFSRVLRTWLIFLRVPTVTWASGTVLGRLSFKAANNRC